MNAEQRCTEFIRNLQSLTASEKLRFMCERISNAETGESLPRVQNFYNDFAASQSKDIQLWKSGHFNKLCSRMAQRLGSPLYSQVMKTLQNLRDLQKMQIKKQAPQYIVHTSCRTPEQMQGILRASRNVTQFGEEEIPVVFGNSEKDKEQQLFYAIRTPDPEHKNINWRKRRQDETGNLKTFYILEKMNQESFCYYANSTDFEPVVSLGGRFGGEWVAKKDITYIKAEKNNLKKMLQETNCEIYLLQPQKKAEFQQLCAELNNPKTASECLNDMQKKGIIHHIFNTQLKQQIYSQNMQRE